MSDTSTDGIERGCECTDCLATSRCTGENAPVAFLVERDGEEIKVCTRCQLSSDKVIETLVDEDTPAGPLMDYDPLGALSLGFKFYEGGESA